MKRLLISLLLCSVIFMLQVSLVSAEGDDHFFQKEQSYELAELISLLIPTENEDYVSSLQNLYKKDLNIYWLKDSINPEPRLYKYYNAGRVGILINGQSRTEHKQKWVAGSLQNQTIEIGYPATVAICGDNVYWQPLFVKIYTQAPSTFTKLTGDALSNPLLKGYFSSNGYPLEQLNKKGDFFFGANLYKISIKGKRAAWIMIETSQGNHTGNTIISIYYNYNDAIREWSR